MHYHNVITLCCMLERYRPSAGLFPIVVSQDCGHEATANTINAYGSRITHIKVLGVESLCSPIIGSTETRYVDDNLTVSCGI